MLVRGDADIDFASGHGRVDLALTLGIFLENPLFFLPGLGFLQPVGGRRRKKDQDYGDGAEEGDQHQAQITDMGAENMTFLLSFVAGRGLHRGVLSRYPGKAKAAFH